MGNAQGSRQKEAGQEEVGWGGGVEHFQGPEEASTYGAESSFLPPF